MVNRRQEDGPPCVAPRAPRQSSIRSKAPAARYLVSWGASSEREFPTFTEALAEYIEHQADRFGVQLYNLNRMVDGADSGLSDDEAAAVEAANEMFCIQVSP